MISLLSQSSNKTSSIECNKHEQNKLCDALQAWIDLSTDLLTELIIEWTEQALSNAIDMNRISSIERNRHEQNKFYRMQ